MPNLSGRYAYSNGKEDDVETVGVSARSEYTDCLGGCGEKITTARCTKCATEAVLQWRANKK